MRPVHSTDDPIGADRNETSDLVSRALRRGDRYPDLAAYLMHRVMAKIVVLATDEFDILGVGIPAARVLIASLLSPGARVGQISEWTSIEQSTVSHMLRRLGRDRLVTRERVEDDNRSVMVHLTQEGVRVATECLRISLNHDELMLKGIEPDKISIFKDVLLRIIGNVERTIPARSPQTKDLVFLRQPKKKGWIG